MSSASSKQALPITAADLEPHFPNVINRLRSVKWQPAKPFKTESPVVGGKPAWRSAPTGPELEEVAILPIAKKLSGSEDLLLPGINQAINSIKTGLAIGFHLAGQYAGVSGLADLVSQNKTGKTLSELQKNELRDKNATLAAIALFASSAYIEWDLSQYRSEEVGNVRLEFGGIPELTMTSIYPSLDCQMFYYGAYLERSQVVNDELTFVKLSILYFKGIVEEVLRRSESLRYVDFFSNYTYKLEHSDFFVSGFTASENGMEASVEFNRVSIDEIVGNRDAKHLARRLVDRLTCYDLATKRNPAQDLGGLPPISLGHGEPGTGKSMLIAAIATMLRERCEWLGLPFLFHPMPDTIVSTYQGGSAENMMKWMKVFQDTSKIIFGPIDDAENNLEERTRQGVSSGVREVIGVLLRNTEGAYAVNHGNTVIQLYTNIPDQIDKAVMSRVVGRMYIGGANSPQDFLDQNYLWWRRYREISEGFVNLTDPTDYQYLSAQIELQSLSALDEGPAEPTERRIKLIFDRVAKEHSLKSQRFFAQLYIRVKADFPFFTSRDVRNIQRAIDSRIMDFDFPSEWHETPETFFHQNYDVKKAMLIELMKSNMKGLSFADIKLREAIRYLDNMVQITDSAREREINQGVTRLEIEHEARARFLAKAEG